MLFEHVTPPLDGGQQSLLEWSCIDSEPQIDDLCTLDLVNFTINLFIAVDLLLEVFQCRRCLRNTLIACVSVCVCHAYVCMCVCVMHMCVCVYVCQQSQPMAYKANEMHYLGILVTKEVVAH